MLSPSRANFLSSKMSFLIESTVYKIDPSLSPLFVLSLLAFSNFFFFSKKGEEKEKKNFYSPKVHFHLQVREHFSDRGRQKVL